MRLVQRLLISHSLLTAVLLGAAGFAVVALVRMTSLLTELREEHLGQVQEEEAVHQAAWGIEVAARHAILACERDPGIGPEAAVSLKTALRQLELLLARHGDAIQPSIRNTAQEYRAYARYVSEENTCARLFEPALREKRLIWDENLTDAWIALVRSLHEMVLEREAEAYAIGATAIGVGLIFGALAVFAAWGVARWMARGVTRPLELLATQARRVGQGNFAPISPVEGPLEVQELASELERTRARLAEIDQLKDAFVASVSHDLRTPLTRLRAALGLMADGTTGPLNAQQRRVIELARSACEREIRLVSALLDMSRVKSGKALRLEAGCLLDDVLVRAMEDTRAEAEEAGVQLELEKEGALSPASLDAALIERAVANLLGNAIRVSSRGQKVRMIRTVTQEGPPGPTASGTWARVVVRDEGPGVRPEVRDRLFEHFFTSPVGNTAHPPGIGLGLPLAREMMRAHGGEVAFLDEPGQGAAFAVWIPLDGPASLRYAAEATPSPSPSARSPA
ncbi:two-component system sensor histidine kinase GlrK [Archangium gephyra]|uniref:histidine kinase n=1 Tax=Archangium gephyra TaxID=48 RepID=A0AAC8Q867_9BACT|nr:HAMP domain-containing sensor histidine kinase [Archangium gephyra]AKJ02636.1 Two-component system sensor histidine kinase/response regulator, hybrid [Archangium gephyra]REG23183.1 two-component system sensor histidine kinase GlrK [Archangium gephyra]